MLTFHETADPKSLEIRRGEHWIAFLNWHDSPKVTFRGKMVVYLDLSELRQILNKWKEITDKILDEAFPLTKDTENGNAT